MSDPFPEANRTLGLFRQTPRRKYVNDPIQEAVCEVRFRKPSDGWAVLPGQLFERLKDRYPAEPTQEGPMFGPGFPGLEMPSPGPTTGPRMQVMVAAGIPGRVRLSDSTGTRLVLIASHVLSVTSERPYEGWESFSGRIAEAVQAFSDVTQKSFDVERMGLRYINRLNIPGPTLEKYFDVRPLSFRSLPMTHLNFLCRSELAIENNSNQFLVGTFASGPVDPGGDDPADVDTKTFILDLDAIEQKLSGISDVQSVMDIAARLRFIERASFESAVTEDARCDIFGGYEVMTDD